MDKKIDYLGRLTIPKEIRHQLHINDNEIVDLRVVDDALVITKKPTTPSDLRRLNSVILDDKALKEIKERKKLYPSGTKVVLLDLSTDQGLVPIGMVGEVDFVDDLGSIIVNWKNGVVLPILNIPNDIVGKITNKEYNKYKCS